MKAKTAFLLLLCATLLPSTHGSAGEWVDLSQATIVAPSDSPGLRTRSVEVLSEEIEKRTGLELSPSSRWPEGAGPIIAVGTREELPALHASLAFLSEASAPGAEGFTLVVRGGDPPLAVVAGEDARGVLYGVGRLLRKAVWSTGRLLVPSDLDITTAPTYPIRGHQLGNRDLNTT